MYYRPGRSNFFICPAYLSVCRNLSEMQFSHIKSADIFGPKIPLQVCTHSHGGWSQLVVQESYVNEWHTQAGMSFASDKLFVWHHWPLLAGDKYAYQHCYLTICACTTSQSAKIRRALQRAGNFLRWPHIFGQHCLE